MHSRERCCGNFPRIPLRSIQCEGFFHPCSPGRTNELSPRSREICACLQPQEQEQRSYLSDLFELLLVHVGEDVELWLGEDLEGHGAVVVLQRGDVVVAHGQLRPRIDLVAEGRKSRD